MPPVSIEEIDRAVAGTNAPQMFLKLASEHPDLPVLHSMKASGDGVVERVESRRLRRHHRTGRCRFATTRASTPNQRILLMMRNRPEFHWFDLAAQFLRATPVSIYNSSSPEEIQYLADHAGAEIAIVEDAVVPRAPPEGPRRAAQAEADLRHRPTGRRLPGRRATGVGADGQRLRRPRRAWPLRSNPTTSPR